MGITPTLQNINYNKYKIFVFDLDYTLFLHDNHTDIYNDQVVKLLQTLKDNNKILCIATHNSYPSQYLMQMKIKHFFDCIIYETRSLYSFDDIESFTPKKLMLSQIIDKYNCTPNDIIFFDDNPYNIDQVELLNIKTILVQDDVGINTTSIINHFNKPRVRFFI